MDSFQVSENIGKVSFICNESNTADAVILLAHGAGAGMKHQFMEDLALALVDGGVSVMRYQFPYMEHGKKRPDPPAIAYQTIAAAIDTAIALFPDKRLFAGGKSFGGRMTSQYISENASHVEGLIFYGFPLHQAGKPSTKRAEHLAKVDKPMLFLQGTRDTLAQTDLISEVTQPLALATLIMVEGADHSFNTLKRSGIEQAEVIRTLADDTCNWIRP